MRKRGDVVKTPPTTVWVTNEEANGLPSKETMSRINAYITATLYSMTTTADMAADVAEREAMMIYEQLSPAAQRAADSAIIGVMLKRMDK